MRSLFIISMLLAVAACSPKAQHDLVIADGWARATAPGQTTGAAYLTIANEGNVEDRLVGLATDRASMAMLHDNETKDGIARMRMMDGLDIPAGGKIELKPGGAHIMLEGLSAPLGNGDRFNLRLHFAKAGDRTVTITVVAPGSR